MSERQSHPAEHQPTSHEHLVDHEKQRANQEAVAEKARQALAEHESKNTTELAHEASKHAVESKQNMQTTAEKRTYDDTPGVQQAMKNRAYKREIAKIQTKLPPTSRRFSKIIHNKTVESISDIGAQTVARPSGLLGGSIAAFVGSLVLYFLAKQYGFRYNYLMMFILFVGGFVVGGLVELLGRKLLRNKHHTI